MKTPVAKLLLIQSVGFLAIIGLSWFVELVDLRSLILGDHPYISDFRESALEMLFVLVVWFLVVGATSRVIKRMHYLEGFARVCAWCHQIHFKGKWMTLEEFLERGLDTQTTHGVCPKCLEKERTALAQLNAARNNRGETSAPQSA